MSNFCEHDTFKDICAICHCRNQNKRLRAALSQIMKLEGEINPCNYDYDDVIKLNDAFIEAYHIAKNALGETND